MPRQSSHWVQELLTLGVYVVVQILERLGRILVDGQADLPVPVARCLPVASDLTREEHGSAVRALGLLAWGPMSLSWTKLKKLLVSEKSSCSTLHALRWDLGRRLTN